MTTLKATELFTLNEGTACCIHYISIKLLQENKERKVGKEWKKQKERKDKIGKRRKGGKEVARERRKEGRKQKKLSN